MGLRLAVCGQAVDVGPAGQVRGVEVDAVATGRHHAVGERCDLLASQVVDRQFDLRLLGEVEVDGCRRVEGVRVVLLEAEGRRLFDRHFDAGRSFLRHRFDSDVLRSVGQLESSRTVDRGRFGLPGAVARHVAENGDILAIGIHHQGVAVLAQLVGYGLDSGVTTVAVGRGADQLTDAQACDQGIVRIDQPDVDSVSIHQCGPAEHDHATADIDTVGVVTPIFVALRRKTVFLQ